MSERVSRSWPDTKCTRKTGHGIELHCTSPGCHEEPTTKLFQSGLPPSAVREKAKGWQIAKKFKAATCPSCVEKNPQPEPEPETAEMSIIEPQNEAHREGVKRAFAMLHEHYNETAKSYERDWSDAKIAAAIERSESFVAKIRLEFFGPAEDPRIGDLRVSLREERDRIRVDLTELRAMVATVEAEAVKRIDAIGTKLAALSRGAA